MRHPLRAAVLALALVPSAAAQAGYRLPPQPIVDLVDAPPAPSLSISPDGKWALEIERDALPAIEDVSRRMLRIAGLRIDPAAGARFTAEFDRGIALRDLAGASRARVPLPAGARLSGTSWSHSSRLFAFTAVTDGGTELFVASPGAPESPRRVTDRLSAVLTPGYRWTADGDGLLVSLVPAERGPEPPMPSAPSGPNVLQTEGDTTPVRTYQDLLASSHDEELFEHFGRSQLAEWRNEGGALRAIGAPGLYSDVEPAPDGEHLLVTRVHRPYSYLFPYRDFPHTTEVWRMDGELVRVVHDAPLPLNVPIEGVPTGPRSIQWTAGLASTLSWVEALDGGDPRVEAPFRDRWMALAEPFDGAPVELARTEQRAREITFTSIPSRFLLSDYDRDRRWTRTWLVSLDRPGAPPLVLDDRSARDRYGDPGRPDTIADARGQRVLRQDGEWIYRRGSGASPEGDRPFLDRTSLATGETQRLWQCAAGEYETVVEIVPSGEDGHLRFATRRESPSDPPNYWLRSVGAEPERVRLTDYPDPQPALRGIGRRLVTYARADGVQLSATLYLPAGYEEGTRLPLFVWAYPLEYSDPGTAGQVEGSPHRFTTIRGPSHLFLLTQGWAVLDGATMPVVGDPETMNDAFLEQVVAAAEAAVDFAVELGVADRDRVAVGGHSYGAFMTANLLAHSDLFRAGVARSGAYNRTLTPFGFQSERRTFWEAPETYIDVSPFAHADDIDEPLLLIHGEADDNSGTFPVQSERLFQAIKGNGGTARLVLLPAEAHGYRARESVLHVLAETIEWLDLHVAQAGPVEAGAPR